MANKLEKMLNPTRDQGYHFTFIMMTDYNF